MEPKSLSIISIQSIRKSMEGKFNNKIVGNGDFMNYMSYLLTCKGNEDLQMEVAWIFTNMAAASSEYTEMVVVSGAISSLAILLSSSNLELVEQALWAYGNIMGDDVKYRDQVIKNGVLERLLSLIDEKKSVEFNRTIAWVFVNMVRYQQNPLSMKNAIQVIPKLCVLATRRDAITRIDALWALTFIADFRGEYIQQIIESNIVGQVIGMLNDPYQKLQVAAMRLLGTIAAGTDEQTQVLLDEGLLVNIRYSLTHHNRSLCRLALWSLSNITVGTQMQAQAVLQSRLLTAIVSNLTHSDIKIVKEALLTVRNLIDALSLTQMKEIFDCNPIRPMFDLIMSSDQEISQAASDALTLLFSKSEFLVQKYTNMEC